jgi:hypothetical protein
MPAFGFARAVDGGHDRPVLGGSLCLLRSRVRTSHAHQAATVASFSGRSEKPAGDLFISQRVIDEEEHSHNDEARNYKEQRITHSQLTLSFMKVIFGAALPAANAPANRRAGFGIVAL